MMTTIIKEINHAEPIGKSLMLLTQTVRLVRKCIDTYFYRKAHLSFVKFMVLKILASKNGSMTPTEIAEWTQTERHNITTLIRRLMKDGLVLTRPNGKDKRSIEVILTDKGRVILSKVMLVANELIDQIMSSFTEGDAAKLTQMLEVLRNNACHGLDNLAKAK
jgi:DNA-binding MarR family transcriptional regulator